MKGFKNCFPFKLGNFECLVIRDTISPMDLNLLFPHVPGKEMEQILTRANVPRGDIMDVMCLFLRTGRHNILIDTGWGVGKQSDSGNLIRILRSNGIQPGEIDTVIISHGHPDHIGGNTDDAFKPLFPNARYIILEKEWEFWTSDPDLKRIEKWVQQEMNAYARKNLTPIRDHFTLVGEKSEVVPGIKFVKAPGHSPCHCMFRISSGAEQLLYSSDLTHHPLQIARPDCGVFGDYDPEQARRTRTETISRAAKTNILVFACHFPFPGLGHIKKKDGLHSWQPIDVNG